MKKDEQRLDSKFHPLQNFWSKKYICTSYKRKKKTKHILKLVKKTIYINNFNINSYETNSHSSVKKGPRQYL